MVAPGRSGRASLRRSMRFCRGSRRRSHSRRAHPSSSAAWAGAAAARAARCFSVVAILAQRGAELVLHGHNHRDSHMDFARFAETGGGSIPGDRCRLRLDRARAQGTSRSVATICSHHAHVGARAQIECTTRGLTRARTRLTQIERKRRRLSARHACASVIGALCCRKNDRHSRRELCVLAICPTPAHDRQSYRCVAQIYGARDTLAQRPMSARFSPYAVQRDTI